MDLVKQRKLAEKLFKDILKHGDKKTEKFFDKGVTPEALLRVWERASENEQNVFGNERLYSLISKTNILSAIENEDKYPYQILTRFVKEKSAEEIVRFATELKIQPLMLEIMTSEFANRYNGVGHNDLDTAVKYAETIKNLANEMQDVTIGALDDIVAFASGIPYGDKDYPNRQALMDLSLDLCKTLSKKLDKSQIKGAGSLKKLNSPIIENDERSIEFIGEIAKVLMDTGFDLYDKDFQMEDSICRKDFSGKLKAELQSYYNKGKTIESEPNIEQAREFVTAKMEHDKSRDTSREM